MQEIPESYKYRADLLKYTGLALLSVPATIIFLCITNYEYDPSKLNFIRFSVALLIGISGIKCLTRGVEILDQYYNDRSKI
jgi:hypothetical protein